DQKWATDVTEFRVPKTGKKLYLSVIIDLYDRYPVAFVLSSRNNNQLVFKTFDKAIQKTQRLSLFFIAIGVFNIPVELSRKRLKIMG
ncbi:DDE-type integrase/transposase/recombinase, partial [Brochothrix thermosphacta]|uniref:DDE-type integrase/transposase/recombinase n=1 Tax=Brochothrix thermosphacta TaxID=2756 RepID=UPI001146ED89